MNPVQTCAVGHSLIMFTTPTCPVCALQRRIADLEAALSASLRKDS